jgi:class 3 adenylate cyclase/tetratricopeptide (TPR) repeat protein
MQCPRCQRENPAGQKFCGECGANLGVTCGSCGADLPAGSKFCNKCGTPVAADISAPARFASPESYTPKHLADRILMSKGALEGERKQVTVLFADLKGSMELLADRDPEEARKILDPVLEHMMEAVHRYEGTVNQVMGDGIMALFGAPLAHEDHAVRAGYAALRMKETLAILGEQLERRLNVPVQVRIGLNAGEVVVRTIGSDLRMSYSAVGQTTHLAHRMEQFALPGSILVTEAFTRLTREYLHFKPLGLVPVKGLPDRTDVFELVGAEPIRARFQAASSRGLTRFVGRAGEIQLLYNAIERVEGGSGQVVAVIGEPGVGKSRLFHELVQSSRTRNWLILETGSVSHGQMIPWMPVRDLLRTYFRIDDRAATSDMRDSVTARLAALDPAIQDVLPAVLWLLDVPVADPAWDTLDREQRRQATLDGVRRILVWLSRGQPLLLVFENLHWLDAETQTFLNRLVDGLVGTRILLLVNYRPEYRHDWASRSYYSQIRLDPLASAGAEELLHTLLGDAPDLLPLTRLLIERTQGNPFFLEESTRTLVETKVVVGQPGAFHLGKELSSIRVPATVQAILGARIDRLDPGDKRLLQTAAVIGRAFSLPLLRVIMGAREGDLGLGLARLQAAEFLYETSLFPDIEYTFKHVLTQEVAYDSLLQDRRRTVHAQILAGIENLRADRLASEVEHLASHAFRGEVWDKALSYLRQAGAKAFERSASHEAVAFFEQALVALAHLPENREMMGQAVDLRFQLQSALHQLGDVDRMITNLHAAETVAASLGDQRWLGRIAAQMTYCYRFTADLDRARDSGERAHAIALTLGDTRFEVLTNYRLSQVDMVQGRYRRVVDLNRRNLEILGEESGLEGVGTAVSSAISSRQILGWSLMALGETTEAIAVLEEGVRLSETVTHEFSRGFAYWGLGGGLALKGHFSEAIPWLERSIILFRRENVAYMIALAANWLGWTYTLCGRGTEGQPLLEEAASRLAAMRFQVHIPINTLLLGEAAVLGGRLQRAMAYAQQTLDLSRAHGQRPTQAGALRLIGDVHASSDLAVAPLAEAAYRESLAMAENLEARPLAARCHLGLGQLNRRTHRHDQARQHLTIAATMLREMGMRFWLEQAEAELR